MHITMLGTGNASVTECYNTCFVISDKENHFLVDGGGGNVILRQLKYAGIHWEEIHHIFVTHKHMDHLTGIIWLVRVYCQMANKGRYTGEVNIYGHDEVIDLIGNMAELLLTPKETKYIGRQVHLIKVEDGEAKDIIGHKVTFFDIQSTKAKQFGFSMNLGNGEKMTCCGDEPYQPCEYEYVKNSQWLLHEAFCLYAERDIFEPYEKHHSTVKDACELAEKMGVENLVLYHTEDKNIENRKRLYIEEGERYFGGNLVVPEDLEVIHIWDENQ